MQTTVRFARSGLAAFAIYCSAVLGLTGCEDLPQEPSAPPSPPDLTLVQSAQVIPHTVTIARSAGSTGSYYFTGFTDWTKGPYHGTRGTFFADVDGDRRADAIVVNDWGVSVRRAPGYYPPQTIDISGVWVDHPYYGSRGTYFTDVTGDGRADAIVVNDWGVVVRQSTRGSFGPTDQIWISGGYYGTRGTFFADVTGPDADGMHRADAVVVNEGGITVRRSTGSGFAAPRTWLPAGYYGSRGTFFADVTCDGSADAIAVNADGIWVRPSMDTISFGTAKNWTNGSWGNVGDSYSFADVDGNGCDDAIIVNNAGIWVRRSAGSFFKDGTIWTDSRYPFFGDVGTFFADVDADNDADAIAVNR